MFSELWREELLLQTGGPRAAAPPARPLAARPLAARPLRRPPVLQTLHWLLVSSEF